MAQPAAILSEMIAEAKEIRENLVYRLSGKNLVESVSLTGRVSDDFVSDLSDYIGGRRAR